MIDRHAVLSVVPVIALAMANQVVSLRRIWIIRREVYFALQALNGAAAVGLAWVPPRPGADPILERIAQGLLILVVGRRALATARAHARSKRVREGSIDVRYGTGGEPGDPEDRPGGPGGTGRASGE
ncbi:hypothetical protein L6R50_12815 [Myxococcota bacterium]|nr:hypothetical protein [Myxococcota bacterium]